MGRQTAARSRFRLLQFPLQHRNRRHFASLARRITPPHAPTREAASGFSTPGSRGSGSRVALDFEGALRSVDAAPSACDSAQAPYEAQCAKPSRRRNSDRP